MAYKYILGQYDHNQSEKDTWITSMSIPDKQNLEMVTVLTEKAEDTVSEGSPEVRTYDNSFKDVALRLRQLATDTENNDYVYGFFKKGQAYYCRCAIKKMPQYKDIETAKKQEYTIKLVTLPTDIIGDGPNNTYIVEEKSLQQYIKTVTIVNPTLKPNETLPVEEMWDIVDFVFCPHEGGFNAILFDLTRGYYDYITPSAEEDSDATTGRMPVIIFLECSQLKNLKNIQEGGQPLMSSAQYRKIGVQSEPGFRMIINGEEIYVGRTGVYELKNQNVKINSFGTIVSAQTWVDNKQKNKNMKDIFQDLSNFVESLNSSEYEDEDACYYIIDKEGRKYINNSVNNLYTYYNYASNKRTFPSFTLDYVYELSTSE